MRNCKSKMILLVAMLLVTLTSTAHALTFSTGNTQRGLVLYTGSPCTARISGGSTAKVYVKVTTQSDVINLAGGKDVCYRSGSGSGTGSCSASASVPGILTGAKARGTVNGSTLGPVGYGVGF